MLCPVEFCQLKWVPTVLSGGQAAPGTVAPARARRDFRPHTDGPARLEPGPARTDTEVAFPARRVLRVATADKAQMLG